VELKFGIVCDAANVDASGKLNILGVFDTIMGREAPVRRPSFTLVLRMEAPSIEGTTHQVAIRLVDADGNSLIEASLGEGVVFRQTGPGRPLRAQVLAPMEGLTFPNFGDYEFHVVVNGSSLGAIPIYVQEAPTKTA